MPTDSTVQDLNQLYTQARTARSKLEPDWYYNLSFYAGRQWMYWAGGRLNEPQVRKGKVLITDNRVKPIVRKEIARMSKQRPVFTVTPNSADQEDTNAAELAEQVMRYLWKHLKLSDYRMKALRWSRITGTGFLKCYWDSTLGPKRQIVLGPGGQVLMGEQGPVAPGSPEHQAADQIAGQQGGRTTVKTVAQGDIKVEARSPFQIFPDPLADTFDEVEWLIEESVKSVEYVKRRYGFEATADTPANPGLIEARMGAGSTTIGSGGYRGVRVREYWCKPCPAHPQGCRTVWVMTQQGKKDRSQILEQDGAPFDPMPYVMFGAIPVPGRLWCQSIVDDLRGPQVELNKTLSQLAENRNRVGNPSLAMSRQATQDPEKTARDWGNPGGIIYYDDTGSPNALPRIIDAPNMPEYVIEQVNLVQQSMQEISGQHEVSSAQVPPGVTAASAINLLQEADDTMISPDMADHEEQLGRLGSKLLKLVGNYYDDSRVIQIGGDNGAWQIFDFKGEMLKGNHHVEVQAGSAFPQSKAAKQAWMQDMLNFFVQSGNAPHGRQLAQFLEDMPIGSASKLVQDYTTTDTQANRENVILCLGQPLPINEYDDDQGHLDNHEDFERQPHFQSMPPQIQQIHMQHTDQHRQKLQQQQQQQLQNELALQGKVPPMLSNAAFQAEQQLSALQGLSQMDQQSQQAQQQQQGQAQQQGLDMASAEQQQRQAEAQHQQQLQHAAEAHQQMLHHKEQQHQATLQRMRQQATAQGGSNGRQ